MGKLILFWILAYSVALGTTEFNENLPRECGEGIARTHFVLTGFEYVNVIEENDGSYSIFFIKNSAELFLFARYTPNPIRGGFDIASNYEGARLPQWSPTPPISAELIRRRNQQSRQLNDTDVLSSLEEVKENDLLPSLKSLFELNDEAIEIHFDSMNERLRVYDIVNEWELGASIAAATSKKAEEIVRNGIATLGDRARTLAERRRIVLETPTKKLDFDESKEDLKNLKILIRAYRLMMQYHFKEEAERSIDRILKAIP